MTTQTITVVFTDLVGSTELLSRVGEAESERLRRELFTQCREAAAAHHGREVKNLGDGLMLAFPAPSAGLDAAVEIQQRLEARNRRASDPLALRIGVSSGEVEEEDGDYFGRPVVEAARLCATAHGGQILATEIVRHLAGSRLAHETTPVGPLELKGLDDPVPAVSVSWRPRSEAPDPELPLPLRLRRSPGAAFVGRAAELSAIDEKVKQATSGGGRQVVLVSGEPGIGKTVLVSRAASRAFASGIPVTYGRCDQDLQMPYQPFVEALGHLVEHLAPLGRLPSGHVGRSIGLLVGRDEPGREQRSPLGAVSGIERSLLFDAVAAFFEQVAAERGLVVVLDDLHWADGPTLSLLGYLCKCDRDPRLAILATFRHAEVGTDHPLSETLATLHREPGVTRTTLSGLSDLDTLEMMEAIAGHSLEHDGTALRDVLLAETRGNPFFLEEMLRHLAESGALVRKDGRWVASADVRNVSLPVSVREVIGRRIAHLGRQTGQLLSVASVLGQDFDLELLSAVSGVDATECLEHCEAAMRTGILREVGPGRFSFAHGLMTRALYDELSATRRAMLHRQTAKWLEAHASSRPVRMAQLAFHLNRAVTPQEEEKALTCSLMAGDEALASLAPEAARSWYLQVLEHVGWSDGDDGARSGAARPPLGSTALSDRTVEQMTAWALAGLGEALSQLGEPGYLEKTLQAGRIAASIDDVDSMARAALSGFRGSSSMIGEPVAALIELLRDVVARTEGERTPRRAMLLARLGTELYWSDLEESYHHGLQAVTLARELADPDLFANVVATSCYALLKLDAFATSAHVVDEAIAAARGTGNTTAALLLLHYRMMWIELMMGERDAFEADLQESERLLQQTRASYLVWMQQLAYTIRALLDGDLRLAEERAAHTRRHAVPGQPEAGPFHAVTITNIRHMQGRPSELVEIGVNIGQSDNRIDAYRLAAGFEYLTWGRRAEGTALLSADIEREIGDYRRDIIWTTTAYFFSMDLLELSDEHPALKDRLPALIEAMEPYGHMLALTSVSIGECLDHVIGQLLCGIGRFDEAERHLLRALDTHRKLRAPYLVASTNLELASLLARWGRPGDRQRSAQIAAGVVEVATEKGFDGLRRRAQAMLAA